MDIKQIAKDAIAEATSRFHPRVWEFMSEDAARDIKVAMAVHIAVVKAAAFAPERTVRDIAIISAEISSQVSP